MEDYAAIHNLAEDFVGEMVNEVFDVEEQSFSRSYCTCKQCRLDVMCFVLNRLKPEYVLSGRGVAFSETDYGEKLQRSADVVALVREGIERIRTTPRPHHNRSSGAMPPKGPVFNIRPVMGRVFDGATFEPIRDAEVSLYMNDRLVPMMGLNWTNPCLLGKNTNGIFTFWPAPVASAQTGERKRFEFTVSVHPAGYEKLTHYFELELIAEQEPVLHFSMQAAQRLQDLYVFAAAAQ